MDKVEIIEKEKDYFETACKRLERAAHERSLLALAEKGNGKKEAPMQAAL